ncbi:MAG: hypothetical protein HPY51_16365 [Candidatus Omnitrophica bacterium]|nr:hypothetical protein [Candidatus Omnitrophota bacterium]
MRNYACLAMFLMAVSFVPMPFGQEEMSGAGAEEIKPVSPEIRNQLATLLPDPESLGARRDGDARFYGMDLYEYINGGAGAFHNYDFVALGHQDYKKEDTDITVDVYYMGNPLNAFGIYAAERSPDYEFIPVGAEGYQAESLIHFVQGPYYVKLSGFSENQGGVQNVLRAFAGEVSRRIGDDKSLPEILRIFPSMGLIPRSHSFEKRAPLGYEFLAPALLAKYAFREEPSTLVLSMAASGEEARERIQKMRERVAKSGEVADYPELAAGAFRGTDRYQGGIIGFAVDTYAVFAVKPPEHPEAWVKSVMKALAGEK